MAKKPARIDLAEAMFFTDYSSEEEQDAFYESDDFVDDEESDEDESEGDDYDVDDEEEWLYDDPPHECECCRTRKQMYRHEIRREFRKARRQKKLTDLAEKKRQEEEERKRKRQETRHLRAKARDSKKENEKNGSPSFSSSSSIVADPLAETRRHLEAEAKQKHQQCLERNALLIEAIIQSRLKKEMRKVSKVDVFEEEKRRNSPGGPESSLLVVSPPNNVKVLHLECGQKQSLYLIHNSKIRLWAGIGPQVPNRESFERILRNSRRVLSNRVSNGSRTAAKSGIKKLFVAKERKLYEITSVNKDQRPIASLRGMRNLQLSSPYSSYFVSLIPHLKRELAAVNDCVLLFEECVTRHNLVNKKAYFV